MRLSTIGARVVLWGACVGCTAAEAAAPPAVQFTDVADQTGIQVRHHSPLSTERHLHLFMGSGIAWLDHDRDGWPDLYVGQGRAWPHSILADPENTNRLLRNLAGERFEDITQSAHAINLDYSMGIAVGDYDNDGFPDLFVSAFGPNELYRNNGDGTFSPVADELGLNDPQYGAGCTWADVDADGRLDLYVCNYLAFDEAHYPLCHETHNGVEIPSGCHPRHLPSAFDLLYHNQGDGTFQDISQAAGLHADTSRAGLGVVAADLDEDGDVDLYVANDSVPNQLWVNDGSGRFVDQGILSGTAVNRFGTWEAGMGVLAGDIDRDDRFDLFVTNFFHETNTLYRNEGGLFFLDATRELGLGAPSQMRIGFGTSLLDVDNDGWLDLFIANGHIHTHLGQLGREEPFEQLPQLFLNDGGRRFHDLSPEAGDYFRTPAVGRSSAVADFNQDGRPDLAVSHLNGPVALLKNETPVRNPSLTLQLIGTIGCRDAAGAIVDVSCGAARQRLLSSTGMGYLSSNEGVVTVALADAPTADEVRVRWPSGRSETWQNLTAGRRVRLVEGTGTQAP